jgi:hypothetical protein
MRVASPGAARVRRVSRRVPFLPSLLPVLGMLAGCAGSADTALEPAAPVPALPQPFQLNARDLLLTAEPKVSPVEVVLDGTTHRLADGTVQLDLAPGRHTLSFHRNGYSEALFALRFAGESAARAQAVATRELTFELRPGDREADLLLVSEGLDLPFFVSLLDRGVSYRWPERVNLHVDRSSVAGYEVPEQRVAELAAFVKSALEELSGGAVTLGEVTTGRGLVWNDFLNREMPGAITLQLAQLLHSGRGHEASGWARYTADTRHRGLIESANIVLDVQIVRSGRSLNARLGHELGHALSLQHPTCRQWSRMDAGDGSCEIALAAPLAPGTFWSTADRAAGKLVHTFLPGTDFNRLVAGRSQDRVREPATGQ